LVGKNRDSWGASTRVRAAVPFTILAGAKQHRLEPRTYLWDVILHLFAGESDLEALLPDCWAARHLESVLMYCVINLETYVTAWGILFRREAIPCVVLAKFTLLTTRERP
jgi:hypothetical protein